MEVREQLERSRLDLLDLTNRNRLLSCAATSRGGLQIVDELSDEVYRILVGDSRAMSFVAREEDPEGESQPVMFGQPDAVEPDPNRHTDNKLQTALGDEQLQRKLLRLYRASKTLIEEQGVNTLYLALGFLHWRESPSVDQFRRAPLILIPVELDRTSVRARFRVTFSGEEIGPNLSLEEKLRLEFGIQLPSLPDSDELSPSNYYESVWRAVQRQDGWTVKPDGMQLGFFSFTKLLMYRDLDVSSWPEGKEPQGHPILAGLLGEDGLVEPGDLVPSDSIDEHPEASDLAQILDADSSQIKAMIEARTARAMIIQGPPGTGKSQTIANLIADAIQRGKRLLFVAEKMAALDVVKRRLDANGVGVACLELHSRTANKKLVLAELGRTLDLGRPKQQQTSISELSQLDSTRERLTRYAKAVNQSIGETGVSPRIAFVRDRNATRSLRKGAPPVKLGEADEWPHSDFREKRIAVEELQARVREGGLPRANPYWGSRRELFLPSDAVELNDALDATRTAVEEVDLAGRRVAEALSVAAPGSIGEADRLHAAVDQVANAPSLEGCDPSSPAWADIANDLTRIFNSGEEQQEIRARLGDTLLPEAWGRDVLQLRADLQATGRSWIRFLLPRWRNARAELAGLCVGEPPKGVDAMLDALDGILQESRLSSQLESERGLLEKIFELPSDYSNVDWPSRRAQAEWVFETRHQIDAGELPSWSFDIDPREARDSAGEQRALATSLANSGNSSKTLTDFLQLDQSRIDGGSLTEIGFPKLKGRIEAMGTRPGALRTLAAFNQKAKQLCEKGLAPLVEAVEKQETPGLDLVALFDHCRYDSLIRRAFEERSELREFDRAEHEHTIERFRKLDKLQFEVHRLRTGLTTHYSSLPHPESGGRVGLLRKQMARKRGHLPVRKLMEQAGPVIQAIKPVFLMSPLSVAQFLPPGSVTFDLVVFDEASQVKAVDGFGALLRGDQAIVVGDSKQLPPTDFFDSVVREEEEEHEHATSDIESLLNLMDAKSARSTMLRWHYRSRHESLIAFSNREFYESRLNVFPSPIRESEQLGLSFRYVPDTVYLRGRTKANNPKEAMRVAEAVMDHARTQLALAEAERETLLVATFSAAQRDAVDEALEQVRRLADSCEEFFAQKNEPFEVKNLENVQGDERDVIFISVGYGRDEHGRTSRNFGPSIAMAVRGGSMCCARERETDVWFFPTFVLGILRSMVRPLESRLSSSSFTMPNTESSIT